MFYFGAFYVFGHFSTRNITRGMQGVTANGGEGIRLGLICVGKCSVLDSAPCQSWTGKAFAVFLFPCDRLKMCKSTFHRQLWPTQTKAKCTLLLSTFAVNSKKKKMTMTQIYMKLRDFVWDAVGLVSSRPETFWNVKVYLFSNFGNANYQNLKKVCKLMHGSSWIHATSRGRHPWSSSKFIRLTMNSQVELKLRIH